jgi:hypothetical protein
MAFLHLIGPYDLAGVNAENKKRCLEGRAQYCPSRGVVRAFTTATSGGKSDVKSPVRENLVSWRGGYDAARVSIELTLLNVRHSAGYLPGATAFVLRIDFFA